LGEAAINEKALRLRPLADAQLAGTEPADQRRPARQHTQLAVVQRQRDEVGGLIDDGAFGRDDDTLQLVRGSVHHESLSPLLLRALGLLRRFLDAAYVAEGVLRQMV